LGSVVFRSLFFNKWERERELTEIISRTSESLLLIEDTAEVTKSILAGTKNSPSLALPIPNGWETSSLGYVADMRL